MGHLPGGLVLYTQGHVEGMPACMSAGGVRRACALVSDRRYIIEMQCKPAGCFMTCLRLQVSLRLLPASPLLLKLCCLPLGCCCSCAPAGRLAPCPASPVHCVRAAVWPCMCQASLVWPFCSGSLPDLAEALRVAPPEPGLQCPKGGHAAQLPSTCELGGSQAPH